MNVTLVTQHYHIRWSSSKLDWQAFHTEEDTKADAERLKGPDEKYVIEAQSDGDCPSLQRDSTEKSLSVSLPISSFERTRFRN